MAAAATVTIATKYGLPQFKEGDEYEQWANEKDIWKMVTELSPEKQGAVIFLSLNEKMKSLCRSESTTQYSKWGKSNNG